jgi:PDZ domain/Aspartyl protease
MLGIVAVTLASALTLNAQNGAKPPSSDPQIGRSFQIPYRLTDTNHFLVRVRINGKGPFNFLVDSGAPALFVATETAKKVGLTPIKGEFWTPIDQLDFEGGAQLTGIKARVDDPFQLVGMNALGLPGASIDGILGFTVLARFRLEIDLSKDRMAWTRLDYSPPDPPVPKVKQGEQQGAPPPGVQVMNAIGPLAKGLAFLMGKQPEEVQHPRGFLGLEWSEQAEADHQLVVIRNVLKESPAARGGLQPGDFILKINDRSVDGLKSAHSAMAEIRPRDSVLLIIRRSTHDLKLTLNAGDGL